MIFFKKIFFIIIVFISFLEAQGKVVAAISSLKGAVLVKPVGTRKYLPAYKGQMLKNGDFLKTKDGVFIAIVFLDGSNIKIQQKTEIKIASYRLTAKELKTSLTMSKGQAWSKVAAQGSGEFTISTPTATASVKGTELDIAFDIGSDETTLTVAEGSVDLFNDLGMVRAGAMTSAKVKKNEVPPEPKKITPDELPTWQKSTDPDWAFKLKPDKPGKQPVGEVIKVGVQILNAKEKKFDDSFSGEATAESQTDAFLVSSDGGTWSTSATIKIANGRGLVHAKGGKEGIAEFIINSQGAESESFKVEYFQSKNQKKGLIGAIVSVLNKLGSEDKAIELESKSLQSSSIIGNTASSVEEILQKIENGELILVGTIELLDNGDGTHVMKMKVQPKE